MLEAVHQHKPDVCILDIDMPGENGYVLAREIVQVWAAERPILIAISGKYIRSSEQLLAKALGFDRFFCKPAEPNELLQFLDDVVSCGNTVR